MSIISTDATYRHCLSVFTAPTEHTCIRVYSAINSVDTCVLCNKFCRYLQHTQTTLCMCACVCVHARISMRVCPREILKYHTSHESINVTKRERG